MRIEVCRCSAAHTEAVVVDKVFRDKSVYRSEIKLTLCARRARLHIVLEQSAYAKEQPLEVFRLLHAMDEGVHRRLALCKTHSTILVPERLVTNHSIGLMAHLRPSLKQLLWQLVESIVTQSRRSRNESLMNPFVYAYLCRHVVNGENPLAVRQLRKLLHNLHVLHKVDIATLWQRHLATLHMERTVGKDIELATETEVLLVVWNKLQMVAQVAIHIHRVGDIETVKRHGCLAYRANKLILEQTDMIVVDVDIGEDFLEHGVQNLACLQHVVHALRARTFNNVLLLLRTLTIDMLRNGLVHRHRQDKLVVVRTHLNLINDPLLVLKLAAVKVGRLYVVEGQRYLLIFVILIVVVIGEVGLLLRSHHALHQFHGGVVLTRVAATLALHHHFTKTL